MKKILAILLSLLICFSLTSCSGTDDVKKEKNNAKSSAFDISKSAYESVNTAYEMINIFSQDIYEAWYMGTRSSMEDEISGFVDAYYSFDDRYNDTEALENIAKELHISRKDLENAVAKLMGNDSYDAGNEDEAGDWYTLSHVYYSTFFSACVEVVSTAYEVNGTADEIKKLLEDARGQMKLLSDKHSDYEHYPNLKKYFTNTTAFFGFCLDPEGSFEQVVETFNTYRNNARGYYYDLNYVFEDELFVNKEEEE